MHPFLWCVDIRNKGLEGWAPFIWRWKWGSSRGRIIQIQSCLYNSRAALAGMLKVAWVVCTCSLDVPCGVGEVPRVCCGVTVSAIRHWNERFAFLRSSKSGVLSVSCASSLSHFHGSVLFGVQIFMLSVVRCFTMTYVLRAIVSPFFSCWKFNK